MSVAFIDNEAYWYRSQMITISTKTITSFINVICFLTKNRIHLQRRMRAINLLLYSCYILFSHFLYPAFSADIYSGSIIL